MSPQTQKHKLRFLKKHKNRAIGYQNEVKKCDLILRLKFDTDRQETKLEGSEFQSGITSTKKKEDLKELDLTRGMKSALS